MSASPAPSPPPPGTPKAAVLTLIDDNGTWLFFVPVLIILVLFIVGMYSAGNTDGENAWCMTLRDVGLSTRVKNAVKKVAGTLQGANPAEGKSTGNTSGAEKIFLGLEKRSRYIRQAGYLWLCFGSVFGVAYAFVYLVGDDLDGVDADDRGEKIRNQTTNMIALFYVQLAFIIPGFWLVEMGWKLMPDALLSIGDFITTETAVGDLKKMLTNAMVSKYYQDNMTSKVNFVIFLLAAFVVRRDPVLFILCWLLYNTGITLNYVREFLFYVTMDWVNCNVKFLEFLYLFGLVIGWFFEWLSLVISFNIFWESKADPNKDYGNWAKYPKDGATPFSDTAIGKLQHFTNDLGPLNAAAWLLVIAYVFKLITYAFAFAFAPRLPEKQETLKMPTDRNFINASRDQSNAKLLSNA